MKKKKKEKKTEEALAANPDRSLVACMHACSASIARATMRERQHKFLHKIMSELMIVIVVFCCCCCCCCCSCNCFAFIVLLYKLLFSFHLLYFLSLSLLDKKRGDARLLDFISFHSFRFSSSFFLML